MMALRGRKKGRARSSSREKHKRSKNGRMPMSTALVLESACDNRTAHGRAPNRNLRATRFAVLYQSCPQDVLFGRR
jgi:hypothetical protein